MKKTITILAFLTFCVINIVKAQEFTSNNTTAILNGATLTVTANPGTNGRMGDHSGMMATWTAPWAAYASTIATIIIEEGVTYIGVICFQNFINLTEVTIPNSVTEIALGAFYACAKLQSVVIPDKVTSIGTQVFWRNSSLTSLTIGESVRNIGSGAFQECTSLESITSKAINPPALSTYVFDKVNKGIPVYVPCSSVDEYFEIGWGNFSEFISIPEFLNVTDYYCFGATSYTGNSFVDLEITDQETYEIFNPNLGDCGATVILTLLEKENIQTTELTVIQNENSFLITWEGDADSYNLYRNGSLLEEGITVTSYTDTQELTDGEEYCYTIKSIFGACESELNDPECLLYSNVGIKEEALTNVKIYPNPTNGQLTIGNCELLSMNVEIYDIMGRALNNIQFSTFNSQLKIDVSYLPAGIYTLRILSENKIIGNYKVVKL